MTADTRKILGTMVLAFSIAFFALGMYFPLLSTHTQLVFKFGYKEITVFKSIRMFFESKEYFLAIVIFLFTFLMPILEFISLLVRIFWNKTNRLLQHFDKWNMLDVFLVALLLLNFKMQSNIMVMQLKTGATFIALSVIFRIITITLLNSPKIKKQ
jgi:paraquat-inducible protein A